MKFRIPPKFSAILGKLSAKYENVIGLDVGSYSVKAVSFQGWGKNAKLRNWREKIYPCDLDAPATEKKVVIMQTVKEVAKEISSAGKESALSVSGNSVVIRYVSIPKPRAEIESDITAAAEPFIPFNITDVNLGYHILEESNDNKLVKTEVVLVAAKKDAIYSKLELAGPAKTTPVIVDTDAFALETLADSMHLCPNPADSVIFLNIGHKTTTLGIMEKGSTRVARDIIIAGAAITKAVSMECKTDTKTAEELKKNTGLSALKLPFDAERELSPEEKVSKAVYETLKNLVVEIRRSVDFYFSQGAGRSLSKIYLCGGSSALKGAKEFFENEFKIPVEFLNPFAHVRDKSRLPQPSQAPSMAVAAGLSLRSKWDWKKKK